MAAPMRTSLSSLARSGRALSIVPESDVDLTASESSLLAASLLTSQTNVPLLRRLQRLTREASLQTSALTASVRRQGGDAFLSLQIRGRLQAFQNQITKFDNATRALSAAIFAFLAKHDNASIPSAKGLAELGENIVSSAPHVALAAADSFKDPSNRTKASDFARAITHMKIALHSVLRFTLLHPLPEPEPLPGKFTGIDSIYYISKAIVETLMRSSSLPASELIRERDECSDALRLSLQLVQMLRDYATEITAGTRRLQRILACAAGIRVYAGTLRTQVKTLLPRTSSDSASPILPSDRKKLEEAKRQLMTSVVEVNENLSAWTQKQKELRRDASLLDTDIWSEEPEEPGRVLYFQDKAHEGALRAGTLNQLVMRLTSETKHDMNFVKAMLVTLHSYTTPDLLFKKLVQRYNVPAEKRPADMPQATWDQQILQPIRLRVLNFLRLWVELRFADFDYWLMKEMNQFIAVVVATGQHQRFADNLTNLIRKKIEQMQAERPVTKKDLVLPPSLLDPRQHAEAVSGLSEEHIAQALTVIEHRMFVDIQVSELLQQAWSKPKLKHKAPNVVALITRFNTLSLWFVYAILSVDKFRARVRFLGKLINILVILFRIGNFNTGYALAIALTHSSIVRLKHSFSEVAPSLLAEFEKAKTLIVPDQGYRRYRAQLKAQPMPKLPYLGLVLADLVLVEEGNPDTIDGLIHFKKRELIYNIILELRNTQLEPYRFNPDRAVMGMLSSLPPVDSSVFRDISRAIEPPGVEKSTLLKGE